MQQNLRHRGFGILPLAITFGFTCLPAQTQVTTRLTNPFVAFSNGLDGSLDQMAQTLKEVGYAGIYWDRSTAEIPALLTALEKRSLAFTTVYRSPKDDIPSVTAALKGKGTLLILKLTREEYQDDVAAVADIRKAAESAAAAGMRVALYPHTGYYMETVEEALRIVGKVNREDVGVVFNLAHFLIVNNSKNIDYRGKLSPLLRLALPKLFAVTLNGADSTGSGWNVVVQPLGRGSFDTFGLVKELVDMGYKGPIALQCYGLTGDKRKNLETSMAAWKDFQSRLTATAVRFPAGSSLVGEVEGMRSFSGRLRILFADDAGLADVTGRRQGPRLGF